MAPSSPSRECKRYPCINTDVVKQAYCQITASKSQTRGTLVGRRASADDIPLQDTPIKPALLIHDYGQRCSSKIGRHVPVFECSEWVAGLLQLVRDAKEKGDADCDESLPQAQPVCQSPTVAEEMGGQKTEQQDVSDLVDPGNVARGGGDLIARGEDDRGDQRERPQKTVRQARPQAIPRRIRGLDCCSPGGVGHCKISHGAFAPVPLGWRLYHVPDRLLHDPAPAQPVP